MFKILQIGLFMKKKTIIKWRNVADGEKFTGKN